MIPPVVTVIVPLKDRLELLKETIDSLQSQTSNEWCCTLVDDGSNTTTKKFLNDLSKSDQRFKILERATKLSGANACRNLGAQESTSKYIIFLDSDDLLSPDSLRRRIMVMDNNSDIDFALFSVRTFVDNIGDSQPWFRDWNGISDLDRMLKMEWPMHTSSPIWRREFFIEFALFDETLPSWNDWEMHVRVLAGNPKYLRFNEPDFYYRTHQEQSRLSNLQFVNSFHLESASNVFVKSTNLLKKNDILTSVRCRWIADQFFGTAYLSLKTDGLRVSIKRLNKSKVLMPVLSKPIYYKYLVRLVYCYLKTLFKKQKL